MRRGSLRPVWILSLGMAALSCSQRNAPFVAAQVSGWVTVSGPVAGVVVHAYRLDDGCGKGAEIAASDATGADGAFQLSLGAEEGMVWLEATGPGSYPEQATGDDVAVDPGVAVKGVVLGVQANENRTGVVLSGLTSMAASLGCARHALGKDGGTLEGAFARAYELIGAHFFDVDIGRTRPAELAGATALTPEVRYALIDAGLSELAREMAEASVPQLSAGDANTLVLARELAEDLGSMEAHFDGTARVGRLSLGLCEHPCTLSDQTVRMDLGKALRDYLNSARNPSGIDVAAAAGRITALVEDSEPELFGGEVEGGKDAGPDAGVEPDGGAGVDGGIDETPPVLTWTSPHDGDAVSGTLALEVTATDATGVSTLDVMVNGMPGPEDGDSTPERYAGTLDTTAFPDGSLTLTASATDPAGNRAEKTITVTVANIGPGVITGVCVKGPLRGAAATAAKYEGGVVGAQLGTTATTDDRGRFSITGIEEYSGPILVSCGGAGASYAEEAFTSTTVLGSQEGLRTVLPSFTTNTASVVVSPWTTLATAYLEYLMQQGEGLAAAHTAAFGAIADLLDVSDIEHTVPAVLDPTATSLSDETWTALTLAGLSQLAVVYADAGQVAPGMAANGLIMTERLETDIADGCLDGKDALGMAIDVGGVPLSSHALRYELADAIAAYMAGSYNQSGLRSERDAIDFLDHLSQAGPAVASATCAPGELFPDPGAAYDQDPPVIAWDPQTPQDGAYVRSPLQIKATAQDVITAIPTLTIVAPNWASDASDAENQVIINVPESFQGDLLVKLRAVDGAGNAATAERTFHVDNSGTAPTITLSGVTRADGWTNQDVTVTVSSTDASATIQTLVDGQEVSTPHVVSATGPHEVEATATDQAGNSITVTKSFTIDKGAPELTLLTPAEDAVVRQGIALSAILDDDMRSQGSLAPPEADTLVVSSLEMTGTPPSIPPAGPQDDGTVRLDFTIDSTADNDGPVSVTWTGKDKAGNSVTRSWSGTIDNTAPTVAIVLNPTLATNPWTSGSVGVSVTVDDANPGTLSTWLDGAAAAAPLTVSTAGKHTVEAQAIDLAGNASTKESRTFYIDPTAPKIVTDTSHPDPTVAYLRQGTYTLSRILTDNLMAEGSLAAPPASFTISQTHSAGTVALGTAQTNRDQSLSLGATVTVGDGESGTVKLTWKGKDRAGNVATAVTWTGTIDTVPPTLSIATVDGLWTNQSSYALTGTATDDLSGVAQIKVNDQPMAVTWSESTWTVHVPLTSDCDAGYKANSFTVTAVDAAGNESDASAITLNDDNCPPTVSVVENDAFLNETKAITSTTSTGVACVQQSATALPLQYDLASPPATPPVVYKYASDLNGASGCFSEDENSLNWLVKATDNGLEGLPVTVKYIIKRKVGTSWVTTICQDNKWCDGVATTDQGATHRIPVTLAIPAGDFSSYEGDWRIDFVARDWLGNVTPVKTIKFTMKLIGGPVRVTFEAMSPDLGSLPSPLKNPFAYGLGVFPNGATSPPNMAGLMVNKDENVIAIGIFHVDNHTPYPTRVRVSPTVFAKIAHRDYKYRNFLYGETACTTNCPSCGLGKYTPLTSGYSACLTSLPNDADYSDTSNGSTPIDNIDLGTVTKAYSPTGTARGCTGTGCTTNIWDVPANGQTDVYLVTDNKFKVWSWKNGEPSTTVTDKTYTASSYRLFGADPRWAYAFLDSDTHTEFVDTWDHVKLLAQFQIDITATNSSDAHFQIPLSDGTTFVPAGTGAGPSPPIPGVYSNLALHYATTESSSL